MDNLNEITRINPPQVKVNILKEKKQPYLDNLEKEKYEKDKIITYLDSDYKKLKQENEEADRRLQEILENLGNITGLN
jgi:FtsZ-binding cell division protein ZapB